MFEPDGTQVFAFDNSYGSLRQLLRLDPISGDYIETHRVVYVEGCCAAITAMWIQRTLEKGDLTSLTQIGTRHEIELAQAAYSRGSFASQRLADNDDAAIDRLIDARGLRVTDARVGALGIGKVEALFKYLAASPGIYYFHMRRPDGLGHAMGLKFSEGAYFLFDPNKGLFKSTDLVTFGYRNDNYVYSNYMKWSEGKFIFRKCEI